VLALGVAHNLERQEPQNKREESKIAVPFLLQSTTPTWMSISDEGAHTGEESIRDVALLWQEHGSLKPNDWK